MLEPLPSATLLGEQLVTLLRNPRVDGVRLPGCRIALPELELRRPIRLLGAPGTYLELLQGGLAIIGEGTLVALKECTVVLKIPARSEPPVSPPRSLFYVEPGARLEMQDCQLRAEYCVGHPYYVSASENRSSQVLSDDIGIQVCSSGDKAGAASLMACSFINFATHLKAETNCEIRVERCGFFRCKGSALTAVCPTRMQVVDTVFEDCNEAGIEVRLTSSGRPETKRTATIDNNLISENAGSGIVIAGEKGAAPQFDAEITISNNRVQNCKQDGICVRDVAVAKLEMTLNATTNTNANGVGIYTSRCPVLKLEQAICKENSYCGVYIQESACSIKACDCSHNGVSGIGIIGSPTKGDIMVEECQICGNKQSGISLLDFYIGTLSVVGCRVDDNKDYGLFLSCHDNPAVSQSAASTSTAAPGPVAVQSKVVLTQGEVKRNRKGGIYLSQQFTRVDCTQIKENGEFAVYIPVKGEEKELDLSAGTLAKKFINGHVGGRWGTIRIYSDKSMCGCTVCTIF